MLEISDSVLINHMHSFFEVSSTPDKVPLGPVNEIMDSTGKENVLHNIVGDTAQAGFGKNGSASHGN